jgi:hypothetical protein
VGLELGSSTYLIDVTFAMSQWHVAQGRRRQLPRPPACVPRLVQQHARTSGGFTQEHVLGGGLHAHACSFSRAHQLLRFRLGCHGLPYDVGRRTGNPRQLRRCALCRQGLRDEKQLVFECIALSPIRPRFRLLFQRGCSMSSLINQDAKRDVFCHGLFTILFRERSECVLVGHTEPYIS